MKQNMKRVILVLCMAVCVFALSACTKKDASAEAVPKEIAEAMRSGAEYYLAQFDGYSDEELAKNVKRNEKQGNTVMMAALESWRLAKNDVGRLISGKEAVLSETVERLSEDSYRISMRVSFEKRALDFILTAEEGVEEFYGADTPLIPTDITLTPIYTTGEKLKKAGMNTAMGMGTVFAVLIFMSFIIASFKNINKWETNMKAKKEEQKKAAEIQAIPTPAAPAPAAPVPAAPIPEPVQEVVLPEENLADDMELVAVITAAIAASQSVPVEGLVVRSIRRKASSKWKNA